MNVKKEDLLSAALSRKRKNSAPLSAEKIEQVKTEVQQGIKNYMKEIAHLKDRGGLRPKNKFMLNERFFTTGRPQQYIPRTSKGGLKNPYFGLTVREWRKPKTKKRKGIQARITYPKGNRLQLGTFQSEEIETAARTVDAASLYFYGLQNEFNFPEEVDALLVKYNFLPAKYDGLHRLVLINETALLADSPEIKKLYEDFVRFVSVSVGRENVLIVRHTNLPAGHTMAQLKKTNRDGISCVELFTEDAKHLRYYALSRSVFPMLQSKVERVMWSHFSRQPEVEFTTFQSTPFTHLIAIGFEHTLRYPMKIMGTSISTITLTSSTFPLHRRMQLHTIMKNIQDILTLKADYNNLSSTLLQFNMKLPTPPRVEDQVLEPTVKLEKE